MGAQKRRAAGWIAGVLSSVIFAGAAGFAAADNAPPAPAPAAAATAQAAAPQIENKRLADREYRTIVLPNGLSVLLTHDPYTDSSAAAMAVGVGFIDDPADKPGLAHYNEHMLFLGTKNFPVVGSYKDYLEANGGGANAYTMLDHTNYFFQVRTNAFEGALQRFSDFFIAPLYDVTYAQKEVEAVNEEFLRSYRNDGSRAISVHDSITKPGHPFGTFGVGNTQTLGGGYNQQALKDFFDRYYAASNMKLALISNLPLDEMEALVHKYFEPIRDFKVTRNPVDPDFRPALQNAYRAVEIEAISDARVLRLSFPTIQLDEYHKSAPASIISRVLGDESEGSLLSRLREEGLAEWLSAGSLSPHPELHMMNIMIGLTPKGLQNRDRVMELFFSYVDMVRDHGIARYTFDEASTMRQTGYRWQSPSDGAQYAKAFSSMMLEYDLKDVLSDPYFISTYDPAAYEKVLETITPENMTAITIAQGVKTDRTTPYYDTPYSLTEVSGPRFDRLNNPPKAGDEGMHYPVANPYIPYNLTLQPMDAETAARNAQPHIVVDIPGAEVWSQYDTLFQQPRAEIKLIVETPRVYDTVESYVKARLLDSCIGETVSEQFYQLNTANLGLGIEVLRGGFKIELGGYTEKLDDLINMAADSLKACRITDEQFEVIRNRFIRSIENEQAASSEDRAARFSAKLFLPIYTDEDKLQAARELTLADVQKYADEVFARTFITGSVYGNLNDRDVAPIIDKLIKALGTSPLPEEDRPTVEAEKLSPGEHVIFSTQSEDNTNTIIYTLNVGIDDPKMLAAIQVLNNVIGGDFYKTLRTERQLGYVVQSYPNRMEDSLSMNFMIQSRFGPVRLQSEIEDWMKHAAQLVDNLSEEQFATFRESLAQAYESPITSFSDVNDFNYSAAFDHDGDFEYRQKAAERVRSLTLKDVKDLAEKLFNDPNTATMAIHIRAAQNDNQVPAGAFTDIDAFKNRNAAAPAAPAAPQP